MFRTRSIFLAAMLVVAIPAVTLSQGKSGAAQGKNASRSTQVSVTVVFRDTDRPVIRDYFRSHSIVGTSLPPGIAKNVLRGKPLPPGIAKKAFPSALVVLLPSHPRVTFIIVGDRVVAMRDGLVIDVMLNVF